MEADAGEEDLAGVAVVIGDGGLVCRSGGVDLGAGGWLFDGWSGMLGHGVGSAKRSAVS